MSESFPYKDQIEELFYCSGFPLLVLDTYCVQFLINFNFFTATFLKAWHAILC